MAISSRAVVARRTRWPGAGGAGTNRPPAAVVPATMVGGTLTPPLAMVAYTLAICTAVVATPWPKASVYRWSPHHFDGGASRPWLLPGSGSPVGTPIPNARKYWYCTCGRMRWATWTMPTLLEWARTPARVSRSVGCGSASWKGNPPMMICSGTVYGVIGVCPRSSAAAAVMTLAVLPGGKTADTGRSWVAARLVTFVGW